MERDCIKVAPNVIVHLGRNYIEVGDDIKPFGLGAPAVVRTADQARELIKNLEDCILHGILS